MSWSEIKFGKYQDQGKTIPEIIFEDPDYFLWGAEEGIFYKYPELSSEADELLEKIQLIKPTGYEEGNIVVEYLMSPVDNKIKSIQLNGINSSRDKDVVERKKVLDLTLIKKYNTSVNALLPQIFLILFEDKNYKPSKADCELFFSNDYNFVL